MLSRFLILLQRNKTTFDLGRWSLSKGNSVIIHQSQASHDHCGCCGTPHEIKYENILKMKTNITTLTMIFLIHR